MNNCEEKKGGVSAPLLYPCLLALLHENRPDRLAQRDLVWPSRSIRVRAAPGHNPSEHMLMWYTQLQWVGAELYQSKNRVRSTTTPSCA